VRKIKGKKIVSNYEIMIKTCALPRLLYSTLANPFADMKSLARMVHGVLPYLLHGIIFLFNNA
jgi:hypothetical protein